MKLSYLLFWRAVPPTSFSLTESISIWNLYLKIRLDRSSCQFVSFCKISLWVRWICTDMPGCRVLSLLKVCCRWTINAKARTSWEALKIIKKNNWIYQTCKKKKNKIIWFGKDMGPANILNPYLSILPPSKKSPGKNTVNMDLWKLPSFGTTSSTLEVLFVRCHSMIETVSFKNV